jgi:hypothetical protein
MITARKKYEHCQRDYFAELKERYGEIPSNHKQAINLRMDFFKKYVLHRVMCL